MILSQNDSKIWRQGKAKTSRERLQELRKSSQQQANMRLVSNTRGKIKQEDKEWTGKIRKEIR